MLSLAFGNIQMITELFFDSLNQELKEFVRDFLKEIVIVFDEERVISTILDLESTELTNISAIFSDFGLLFSLGNTVYLPNSTPLMFL